MPNRFLKELLPIIIGRLFRKHKNTAASSILDNPQSILLIKQSERIGNIVLLNAAISGLALRYPSAKIDLLLPAVYMNVMTANSHVSSIIPVYKRKYVLKPWMLLRLIGNIRRQQYGLAIDCSDVNSHSSTGLLYTLMSGAKLTAGWRMSSKRMFDIEIARYTETIHASEMYLRLLSAIFKSEIRGEPYFDLENIPKAHSGANVGINCGGRGNKRWPLQNFIQVGKLLSIRGYRIDFILGPDENSIRSELAANLPDGCSLLPLTPLPKLMQLMAGYQTFISSDTGPMHLAWSLRLPVIGIFIDSEIEKFRPLSPGSMALDGKENLAPERVTEIALQILNSRKINA